MRQHFSKKEVKDLVLFAQSSINQPTVPGYVHPTIGVQYELSHGLNDFDGDYTPFAEAYLELFNGANVQDVADNVYRFLAHE